MAAAEIAFHHCRTFVVCVSEPLSDDTKQVALAAAGELFDVDAGFDSDTVIDGNEPNWITVKSRTVENADGAKAYLIACFRPQAKCSQLVSRECMDIFQDGLGLWWRSLEHEFKVRIKHIPSDPSAEEASEMITLQIQGEQDAVAYASSYISELNAMVNSPPIETEIDCANVRREFTKQTMNYSQLKWSAYSKYNPYVLRTLLKWIFFVKGVTPADDEFLLTLPHNNNNQTLVVLSSDDDDGDDMDEPVVVDESNNAKTSADFADKSKRKKELNSGTSSGDDTLEVVSTSFMGVSSKNSSKRFALSTSPSTTHDAAAVTLAKLQQALLTAQQMTALEVVEETQTSSMRATQSEAVLSNTQNNTSHIAKSASESTFSDVVIIDDREEVENEMQRTLAISSGPPTREPKLKGRNIDFKKLRPIIIDGSNVAMQFKGGRSKIFCCRGILIAARWFVERGHRVLAFVPQNRQMQNPNNPNRPIEDQWMLNWMESHDLLVYSPSKQVIAEDGSRRRYNCYDDKMIVQYAHLYRGIAVSNDYFRDVQRDHPEYTDTIHNRHLQFTWIHGEFFPPLDPRGRTDHITLDEHLRFQPGEPIPENTKFMTAERCLQLLREIDEALTRPPPPPEELHRYQRFYHPQGFNANARRVLSVSPPPSRPAPWGFHTVASNNHSNASRTRAFVVDEEQEQQQGDQRDELLRTLCEAFPEDIVRRVMDDHQNVNDAEELGFLISEAL